jgi:hypothetical protein
MSYFGMVESQVIKALSTTQPTFVEGTATCPSGTVALSGGPDLVGIPGGPNPPPGYLGATLMVSALSNGVNSDSWTVRYLFPPSPVPGAEADLWVAAHCWKIN